MCYRAVLYELPGQGPFHIQTLAHFLPSHETFVIVVAIGLGQFATWLWSIYYRSI